MWGCWSCWGRNSWKSKTGYCYQRRMLIALKARRTKSRRISWNIYWRNPFANDVEYGLGRCDEPGDANRTITLLQQQHLQPNPQPKDTTTNFDFEWWRRQWSKEEAKIFQSARSFGHTQGELRQKFGENVNRFQDQSSKHENWSKLRKDTMWDKYTN